MHGAEKGKARAAEDDIMKMADNELGVMDVDVGGGSAEDQPGQPADGK